MWKFSFFMNAVSDIRQNWTGTGNPERRLKGKIYNTKE